MKNSYKNVLVAVPPPSHEWYKNSVDVLRKAASMISLVPDARITFISIVSVIDMVGRSVNMVEPDLRRDLSKELREERKKDVEGYIRWFTDNGVSCSIRIEQGDGTVDTLLKVVREMKPDLLLLGFHHKEGIFDLFMPDIAKKVARHAPCDVMLVAPANLEG
ncbi:MAG: universal stress protein [Nitrospinae bacterium]|nr:universal stress protein [Nitrospinota bacterium]